MRTIKTCLTVALVATLSGCAVYQKAKNGMARWFSNEESTHKVEIVEKGHGSGVVIHEDGYILTNHHVAGDGDRKLRITITEGREARQYDAKLIASEASVDLGVIKIERKFANPVIRAEPNEFDEGEAIYNIGYPYHFGEVTGRGYISKRHYDSPADEFDMRGLMLCVISDGHGTSGSGVFSDRTGKLIGIMMGYNNPVPSSASVQRMVIPIEVVRAFLDRNKIPYHSPAEAAKRGWAVPVSAETKATLGIDIPAARDYPDAPGTQ